MGYGLKITDTSGNIIQLTSEVSNIVSSGLAYIPTALRPDNTFGMNVNLPGLNNFDESDLGAMVNVREWGTTTSYLWVGGGLTPEEWGLFRYVNTAVTYYEHNDADGAMSSFTPEFAKDTIFNQHGIGFWDKLGETEFDTIRLFAAQIFYIYDRSASSYKKIYALGLLDKIDFLVLAKNLE